MRRVLRLAAVALGLLFVLLIAAVILIDTAFMRAWITETLNAQLAGADGTAVVISDLGPGLPGTIRIGHVAMIDADGTWLEIEAITVEWSPWALLGGNLDIEAMTIAEVAMARAPLPGETQEAQTGSDTVLPQPPGVGMRLGSLRVERVRVSEALTGQALAFGVEGSADVSSGGSGAVRLQVEQTLGGAGRLMLDSSFDLARDDLVLALEGYEEAGGLLVTILGVPDSPPLSLNASLTGAASDFSGTLRAEAGPGLSANLELSGGMGGSATRIAVQGAVNVVSFLDESTMPLVGEAVGLDFNVTMAGELLTLERAQVDLATATLATTGTVDLGTEALGLTIDLENDELAPLLAMTPGFVFEGFAGEISLGGTLGAPHAGLRLALDRPSVEGFRSEWLHLEGSAASAETGLGWSIDLAARFDGAATGEDGLDALLGDAPSLTVDLNADAAFETVALTSAILEIAAGRLNAQGSVQTGEGRIDLTALTGQIDLEKLTPLSGMPISGQLELRAAALTRGWTEQVQAALAIDAREFSTDDPLGAVLGPSPALSAQLTGNEQTWTITGVTLSTPLWEAAGEAQVALDSGQVSGTLGGALTIEGDLARAIDPSLAASGVLTLSVLGTLDAPNLDARLNLAKAQYGDFDLEGLALAISELSFAGGLEGSVVASLPQNNERLAIGARVSSPTDFSSIMVSQVTVRGLEVDLAGEVTVPLDGRPMEGRLAGGIGNLGALAGLAGVEASGAGLVALTLGGGPAGSQDASVNLALADATVEDQFVADLRVALDALDLLNTPVLSLRMSADGVSAGGQNFSRILAQADGSLADILVSIQARSEMLTLDTSLTGDFSQGVDIVVQNLDGTIGKETFGSESPFSVKVVGNDVAVQGFVLDYDGGKITLSVNTKGEALYADGEISDLPVAALGSIHEALDLKGMIDGVFDLSADGEGASAHLDIKATSVGAHDDPQGDVADLSMTAVWDGRAIVGKVAVTGIDNLVARAEVTWPLVHHPQDGTVLVAESDPFSAALTIKGGLAQLWDRLPIGDQTLSGELDVALEAKGTLAAPRIEGSARIVDARYENLTVGTLVNSLNLTTELSDNGKVQFTLNGKDGRSGAISLSGTASFNKDAGLDLDTTLTLQNFYAVNLDNAEAAVSGQITYLGTLLGGSIKGDVRVEPVEINVAQNLPPSVTELNAQDVFSTKGDDVQRTSDAVWSSDLAVTVSFPVRFRVFGRGLDSQWSGKVEIKGTTDAPLINGSLVMNRGTLDVAGNVFTLTEGNVTLRPEDNFDPSFLIVAQAQAGDIVGEFRVSGRVSDPKLAISSVPPLPEDEVLARTLFGKNASSLSGLEALQMASALAGLTGSATGGTGILDRTRAALGVDVLRVDSDADGNARVGAGRYITDGVYVGVEQGTGAGSSVVEVEIEVTDHIVVTTEAGSDASARAGVEWRWDY
jgi:translocation and assembly module TamB